MPIKTAKVVITEPGQSARMQRISGNNRYMTVLAIVREAVKGQMELYGWSEGQVARKAGVHKRTLVALLNGATLAPQLPTLYFIYDAVELDLFPEYGRRRRRRK